MTSSFTVSEPCPTATATCWSGATPACISTYNPSTARGASSRSAPQSVISSVICCPSEWQGLEGGGSHSFTCGWHQETSSWSVCYSVFQSSQVWTEVGPTGSSGALTTTATYSAGEYLYYPLIPAFEVTPSGDCPVPTGALEESKTLPLLPPMPHQASPAATATNGTAAATAATPVPTAGAAGASEGRNSAKAVFGCALLAILGLGTL